MMSFCMLYTHLWSGVVSSQPPAFVSDSPQPPHPLVGEAGAALERGQLLQGGTSMLDRRVSSHPPEMGNNEQLYFHTIILLSMRRHLLLFIIQTQTSHLHEYKHVPLCKALQQTY